MNYRIGIWWLELLAGNSAEKEHWTEIARADDHLNAERVARSLSDVEDKTFSIRIGDNRPYVHYTRGKRFEPQ